MINPNFAGTLNLEAAGSSLCCTIRLRRVLLTIAAEAAMTNSRSIGSGSIADGTLTLFPPSEGTIAQSHRLDTDDNGGRRNAESSSAAARRKGKERGNNLPCEPPVLLSRSTHSFLFTEPTCSAAFAFAVLVVTVSCTCLVLSLIYSLADVETRNNPLSIPVNVDVTVKITQYLALFIGLIMEEEIPESLYLLRVVSEKSLRRLEPDIRYSKFVVWSSVRVVMGYLFLSNLFIFVCRATSVIDIFFDVLALQSLQQIDDVAFRLARLSVFGRHLKQASLWGCFRREVEKLPLSERRGKMTQFVSALYLVNFCTMMAGMAIISRRQSSGCYTCASITVRFSDEIWENAFVLNSTTGRVDNGRFYLIYSYFNGKYVVNGTHDGRSVYTEQNKFDDRPYEVKIGATTSYCKEEQAWMFMHERIRKDANTLDSTCPWLLRSPETFSFDLLEVSGDWSIWTGVISDGASFRTTCNGCETYTDCNFHGACVDGRCVCEMSESDGFPLYMGTHCELSRPCARLESNEGGRWELLMSDEHSPWRAYGRGVYNYDSGSNVTLFEDDSLVLVYTGSRWFFSVFEDGKLMNGEYWLRYSREVHTFWDRLYQDNTKAVSNPTSKSDPIAVDFFFVEERGERYGPLGKLVPTQDPPGSGFFECVSNISIDKMIFTLNFEGLTARPPRGSPRRRRSRRRSSAAMTGDYDIANGRRGMLMTRQRGR